MILDSIVLVGTLLILALALLILGPVLYLVLDPPYHPGYTPPCILVPVSMAPWVPPGCSGMEDWAMGLRTEPFTQQV